MRSSHRDKLTIMSSLRLGLISAAHVHAPSYAWCAARLDRANFVGLWDDDAQRGSAFVERHGGEYFEDLNALFDSCDAVVVAAENTRHAPLAQRAAKAGKHILCEKPLATTMEDAEAMVEAAERAGVVLMTAFPCPYSPAFEKALATVERGDLGTIRAICATNRGTCPFGWFTDGALSGGGAMMDHTVHVADLLYRMLKRAPKTVQANIGRNMYGEVWEDSAIVNLEYGDGVFATIDASWSRLTTYKTWGDVTLNIVCDQGVVELDLFGQQFDFFGSGTATHRTMGYGSNLDLAMVGDFVSSVLDGRPPRVSGADGLEAARIAISGYKSVREGGEPVAVVA